MKPALRCLLLLLLCAASGPVHAQDAVYTVRPGDTLFGIAQQHGLTVAQLQAYNDLSDDFIKVGQPLRVQPPPVAPPAARPETPPEAPSDGAVHLVRPGDTLYRLARHYGISVDTLHAHNPDLPAVLHPGDTLVLPAALVTSAYTVRRGDTLFRIAQSQGVTVAALRQANDLDGNRIEIGQVLQVPASGASARPAAAEVTAEATGAVLVYPDTFAGRLTASGRPYDPARHTASHLTLPLGTVVLLHNPATGRRTFAEITDRGPLGSRYLMDISAAVAEQLGLTGADGEEIELYLPETP